MSKFKKLHNAPMQPKPGLPQKERAFEEMCNCSTVAGAVFFKIDGLSMISKRKDRYQDSHDMLHGRLREDTA